MGSLGKVLIIDDEASLRQTLTRILQKAGCETLSIMDGQQAMHLLGEQLVDLVFLDIHLPQVDGMQILKEIRQQDPKLPVILLTGYGSIQSAVEALRLGATDYLLKPFDPDVLVARTRTILREQATERRRQEIREQITALQAELGALDKEMLPSTPLVTIPSRPQDRFLKRGPLILDIQAQRATLGDEILMLPPTTFTYLLVLAQHSPEVVDYQSLVTEAQGYQVNATGARELAKWHVHTIRQALEIDPGKSCHVVNVRGVGYRFLVN